MNDKRPDMIKIFAHSIPTQQLVDLRWNRNGFTFGNILNVARQYGILSQQVEGGIVFVAPKSRMQLFAEKLHFAQVAFFEMP